MRALPHEGLALGPPHQAGARFGADGRFEVLEVLGTGGAGVVFLVSDRLLGRKLAAKFMREVDGRSSEREALAEARATAQLNHPNIVTVFDLCSSSGTHYILMEYLEGSSLDQLVGDPGLTAGRSVEIVADVARGLEHAHARGVLHLDLKPKNVFVETHGRAKILDFGVGSLPATEEAWFEESAPGRVVGTPLYMAPEQWGLGPLDVRTDIWATGMILRELLTGAAPEPDSAPSQRLRPSVPRIAERLQLPSDVDSVLALALAPDPADRFQETWQLRAALERLRLLLPEEGRSWVRRRDFSGIQGGGRRPGR